MKVLIGSDHRGFHVKQRLVSMVSGMGHDVGDLGVESSDISVDYPDTAFEVARSVGTGLVDRGILVCGTGIGMCIAANKVAGVRAACCHDLITTEMSRRHNDANILCLSADMLGEELVERMVQIWLNTTFDAGRHQRRIEKIIKFEATQKRV